MTWGCVWTPVTPIMPVLEGGERSGGPWPRKHSWTWYSVKWVWPLSAKLCKGPCNTCQGWFSFLVEGIVNPERFLLLFSLSFLIKHTHTVGVASPPVSFSVKWDCGASGETETYLLGLFLFASKVRPTVRLLSCVSSCIRRGLTSAGAKLFASLLAAVMGH